jgi:hypothetical protein
VSDAKRYNLEKGAAEVVAYLSQGGPALYELPLGEVRKAVDGAQAGVPMPGVEEAWVTVPAEVGDVRVLLIKPRGVDGQLPVVLYMHGGLDFRERFQPRPTRGRACRGSRCRGRVHRLRTRARSQIPGADRAVLTRSLDGSPSKETRGGSTRRVSPSPETQPVETWRRCYASWRSSAVT